MLTGGGWDSFIDGSSVGEMQGHSQVRTAGGSLVPTTAAGFTDRTAHGGTLDQSQFSQVVDEQFQSPISGFAVFADRGNPWPTPETTAVPEEGEDIPRRQQPQRHVKGKGRICHTGSHIL